MDLSFATLVDSLELLLLLLALELLETAGLAGTFMTMLPLARMVLGLGRTPSGCRGPTGVDSIGSDAL